MAYYSSSGSTIKEGAAGIGRVGMPARYSPVVAARALTAACPKDCKDDYAMGILTAKGFAACCAKKFPEGPSWSDFESCILGARKGNQDALECLAWYRNQGYITQKGFLAITGRRSMRGIGEFFDAGPGMDAPSVHAFQDGVFGGGTSDIWMSQEGNDPGPLQAYKDGSLGAYEQAAAGVGFMQAAAGMGYDQAAAGLGLPLYVDGQQVDQPMTIYHGPAGIGATAIERGIPKFSGPLDYRAFNRMAVLRGLGQANGGTLDLTDPATVKEVKTALAFAMPAVALSQDGQAVYTESWYASPIWDKAASELMASFTAKALEANPSYQESDLATTTEKGMYPTAAGVMTILAMGVGSPGYGTDPNYFPTNFPILNAFQQKVAAAGGDTSKVDVKAPYFTEAEKIKGKGFPVSTMAIVGLGAVAAVGAYLVLRKKR